MSIQDLYPSRKTSEPAILPRRDPVVYTDLVNPEGPLSDEQLNHYDTHGYLLIPNMLSAQDVHAFQCELHAMRHDQSVRESECAITEPDSDVVRSIFNVTTLSHTFFALSRNGRLLDMVHQILGDDIYVHQSRVNLKPGFNGKEFQWHSDFETWHTEDGMPRMRAVSCSISLTENNEFNGPLMLVPGSHRSFIACVGKSPEDNYKRSLKKQTYGVPDEASLKSLVEDGGIVSAKGLAGSVLFFDCNTMHGSNSNISPYPRSNVFIVYNSVTNRLVTPFFGGKPRPGHIACRDYSPIVRVDVKPCYAAL